MEQPTKTCHTCGKKKQSSEFSKHPNTKDGLNSTCRLCDRARHARRRERNIQRHKDGPSVTEKKCPRCATVKPAAEFPLNPSTETGLASYCSPCKLKYTQERARLPKVREASKANQKRARESDPERFFGYRIKKAYNITVEDYNRILDAQDGKCAICGAVPDGKLHVDHDHSCCPGQKRSCGQCVRGLLCTRCNTGLGMFQDSVSKLKAAIRYLA